MSRYADPSVCPDCRAPLPPNPTACPACELDLTGPLVPGLFRTLQRADELVAEIRRAAVPAEAATETVSESALSQPTGTPATAVRRSGGLRAASVPKILLSLGALCLLAAAVIFLAVAWSWLGIGGRTAVLVGLTLAAGGLGSWLSGRGLRVAGEAMTTVALGLVVLDVVGAEQAGWFGDLDAAATACLVGGALLAASLGLISLRATLQVPQVVAALGLWVLAAGVAGLTVHDQRAATAAVLAFAGLVALGRFASLRTLAVVAAVGGGTWWAALAAQAVEDAATHATLRALWLEGHGWGLLTASILLLLPAIASAHLHVVRASLAASALGLTVTLGIFATDDGPTRLTLAALALLVVWAAAAHLARGHWAVVPRVPLAVVTVPVLATGLTLATEGVDRVLVLGEPFTRSAGVRLPTADSVAHPGLLVPAVLGVLLTLALLPPRPLRLPWPLFAVSLGLVAGAGTLTLLAVPLWTITASLGLIGLGLVADAVRRADGWSGGESVAGLAVALAAVIAARSSDWLTAAATFVLVLAAATLLATDRVAAGEVLTGRRLGGAVLPAALAGLVWSVAEIADVETSLRAAPILVVLGLLALARPRVELETVAALAALVSATSAGAAAADPETWLAVHLTLAGALVSASALVHRSRRLLGWVGGFLLAAATWVRLADLGVEAPEAYTLPSAVALTLVGLWRLRDEPASSTSFALTPGLALATVPSLLWVLAGDPITLRAALLGAGCLGLVLAGATLRWNAPLLIGSVVGAVLVLRELAPYLAQTPQWILIGLAGTVLTVVGVTWERRVNDLQRTGAYLARLR
ncbi:SCO7613 C-terminal domain-containing membrane protein [Nocardioides sp.]|uniref:SCO7613 C-terminal domain-containing membrane protein n=1 Tax=Nocardioides sp. TaxID=35761 RepID=UPI0035682B04